MPTGLEQGPNIKVGSILGRLDRAPKLQIIPDYQVKHVHQADNALEKHSPHYCLHVGTSVHDYIDTSDISATQLHQNASSRKSRSQKRMWWCTNVGPWLRHPLAKPHCLVWMDTLCGSQPCIHLIPTPQQQREQVTKRRSGLGLDLMLYYWQPAVSVRLWRVPVGFPKARNSTTHCCLGV